MANQRIAFRLLLTFLLMASCAAYAQQISPTLQSAVGKWQVIDDKTGQPGGKVELYLDNGKLYGKILDVKPGRKPDAVCDKCTGDLKGKPIKGMQFLSGFSPDGNVWSGGTVVDPENGKTYRGKITPKGTDTLELRGYVGIPLFGRSETWKRLQE